MGSVLKYSTACVNKPAETSRFLNLHLNFVNHNTDAAEQCDSGDGVLIGNKFGNNYLLCAPSAAAKKSDEAIIINTDNCLRDFHQLKNAGIQIVKAPKYTTTGLEAVFADNYGNKYVLVEKRDYSD
jgi:hypothetical protein